MATTTDRPTNGAVDMAQLHAALLELLTRGQHHDAASGEVLARIGHERVELPNRFDGEWVGADHARLAVLVERLGRAAHPLAPGGGLNLAALYDHLIGVAAVTLAWLDDLHVRIADEEPF